MRSFRLPVNNLLSGVRRLRKPARRINLISLLLSALVLGGVTSIAVAQSVNSRVSGLVKDTAGASVPGAKIVLMDTATKDTKEATTSEDGAFMISDVRPGAYTVVVEATGFKKLSVTNLTVHVDTPVVLNSLTLEAGGIAETVSVTASDAQSLIRSEDAKLSTTVDVKQGAASGFETALATEQAKLQGETLWYRLVIGGEPPRYVRIRPRVSLAAILDARAEQTLPESVTGMIAKITVETLNLRPNMLVNVTPHTQR